MLHRGGCKASCISEKVTLTPVYPILQFPSNFIRGFGQCYTEEISNSRFYLFSSGLILQGTTFNRKLACKEDAVCWIELEDNTNDQKDISIHENVKTLLIEDMMSYVLRCNS